MDENENESKSEAAVDLERRIHLELAHRKGMSAWARSLLNSPDMLSEMAISANSLAKLEALETR